MSVTYSEREREAARVGATGTIAEAAGSIAVIVLSIIGLAQATPSAAIVSVAVIVMGAALLAEGGALAGEFARLATLSGEMLSSDDEMSGMSVQVAGGGVTLILGILALLGVAPPTLTSVAVILIGSVLLLTSGTVPQIRQMRARLTAQGSEVAQTIGRSAMTGMAGAQFLCGVAAIVLGILALSHGASAATLILVGLLVSGGAMTVVVTAMSGNMLRFFTR